jgi:hypothetical protein
MPGRRSVSVGCRCNALTTQDVADGLIRPVMTQVGQRSYNAVITPAPILASETNHQRFHLNFDAGTTG